MKKIGYTNDSYPERRTIIDGNLHPLKKVKSLNTYYPQTAIKRMPILGKNAIVFFKDIVFSEVGVDGLHLFNTVTKKNIPWISTFETYIPRTSATSFLNEETITKKSIKEKNRTEKYVKLLAHDNCKKIISLSQKNYEMELRFLEHFPQYKNIIKEKMIQINPPQKKLMEKSEVEQKVINPILKFLFVGKDFTRKGGKEIVDVFSKIKEEHNFDFELTIVSLGKSYNYAFGEYQDTEKEVQEMNNKIRNTKWINFYESMDNKKLLEMMKNSDVGLLPTWADTYGYSVLEFQASGCPVITTNIRALPEINNSTIGWVIQLPIDESGEVEVSSINKKQILRKQLQNSFEKIILEILENPQQIKEKTIKSYNAVIKNHSVKKYMKEISVIYSENF
ncbi:glycosyltransferase family 4 protein [Desemzia sp. FAM 23991]|uniref:glycosyltransferase family 4 protein n=1 Tax=unclassified Desemzia TaxID=2685243 RepID=UPI0038874E6D